MPLSVEAWDAGTGHLSDAEDGLYGRLIRSLWQMPNQRFPNDMGWLARRFRRSLEEAESTIRPLLVEFFQNDGNWITHKRVTKEFARARKLTKQRSDAAKSRWQKEKPPSERNAGSHGSRNARTPTLTPTHTLTDSPLLIPPEGDGEPEEATGYGPSGNREPRKTQLPADWQPDPRQRQYAVEHRCEPDATRRNFVEFYRSHGRSMADWNLTWQRWCRTERNKDGSPGSYANGSAQGGRQVRGGISGAVAAVQRAYGGVVDDE